MMTLKEYNRRRYRDDRKKSFLSSVRSYVRILQALGATVTLPDDDAFQENVDAYMATRQRRERIDWGEDK